MRRFVVAVLVCAAGLVPTHAQNSVFGKNKVQYKHFEWQFIQTDHFDVYYAQDGYPLASYTADVAEAAYDSIRKLFRYEINNRVALVVYNSHNEFQQTNVVSEYLEEGIGGVTELFKNRVVIPFEGSYAQFRHVIHHELVHAVLNDMFYGGTIQSLISNRAPVQLPIWFNEGLAEYAALRWDTNSDMFIRDATVHNYLPPIEYLNGYFAYRGGQSLFYYIQTKYGEQKIGELLSRMRSTRSVDGGFRAAIGLSVKDLSERWQKEMKVLYWPDVAKREEPVDFATKRLTNHTKLENFYNTSPALSPQGDRIAFISDRDDYFDVYLLSALDGEIIRKVVDGQKTRDFEELHLLTPGIGWSPDGKRIALAVKAGDADAIMLVDVDSGRKEKIALPLDGIFSVNWSADGGKLTFIGLKTPQTDVYTYDLRTKELRNLTNDIFSDADPVFSPDGRTIYFSSDRRDFIAPAMVPAHFQMSRFNAEQTDLYAIDVESGNIRRITNFPNSNESSPIVSPDGKKLLFISDRNGINNIYAEDLATGKTLPITNSLSGLYQLSLSRDGSKLAFASLNEAGFDIYIMSRPLERRLNVTELEPTEYFKRKFALPREEHPHEVITASPASGVDTMTFRNNVAIVADTSVSGEHLRANARGDYSSYIFGPELMRDTTPAVPPIKEIDVSNSRDAEGSYLPRKYKLSFTPDLVYGSAGYSTFYGLQGSTVMAFSDMLGDHQIVFQTNLLLDLKNSDYGLSYFYLPGRIDWGFEGFHSARFVYLGDATTNTLYRFQTWGLGATASYPIDRFNRLDVSVVWMNVTRDNLDSVGVPTQAKAFFLPTLSYVNDNSVWQGGWFGPNNGSRFFATLYATPKIGGQSLDMQAGVFDYRQYTKIAKDFILALRMSGGASIGNDAHAFFIGGTEGWINRTFDQGRFPINNAQDFVFLTPVLPLRGYNYNVESGTHFGIVNAELRFPLVRYLILGALPIGFQNILGTIFFDMGSAWNDTHRWQGFEQNTEGVVVTRDLLMSTGLGTRLGFFGLPLRIDIAWRFRWGGGFSEPVYMFSLGADY